MSHYQVDIFGNRQPRFTFCNPRTGPFAPPLSGPPYIRRLASHPPACEAYLFRAGQLSSLDPQISISYRHRRAKWSRAPRRSRGTDGGCSRVLDASPTPTGTEETSGLLAARHETLSGFAVEILGIGLLRAVGRLAVRTPDARSRWPPASKSTHLPWDG